jgi:hypothetical protein
MEDQKMRKWLNVELNNVESEAVKMIKDCMKYGF